MKYDVGFYQQELEHDERPRRIWLWFVFDAFGATLKSGFRTSQDAHKWALEHLGWRDQ